MEVNDNAGGLTERVVWTFFASRLAPTGVSVGQKFWLVPAQPLDKQRKQLRLRTHLQFQVQVLAVHAHGFR
ncbi:hypothetical protein D3C76_713360 [compost metagenome]